jgi:hypothetical protein
VLDIGISTDRSGKETETKVWKMQLQKNSQNVFVLQDSRSSMPKARKFTFIGNGEFEESNRLLTEQFGAPTHNRPWEFQP